MQDAHQSFNPLYRILMPLCLVTLLVLGEPATRAQSALRKRLEQTNLWVTDQGAKSVQATNFPLRSSPSLSAEDRKLVRWCMARYALWGVYADKVEQVNAEKSAEQAAKRFFDAMPRAEIARRLVPIRKALYRGTRAYTSVAFVLAYYDIDFERNAQRVVEALSLIEPPAKLKAAGYKEGEEQGDSAGVEEVADAVEALYQRHHSAALLRAYLNAPADGHIGEDRWATVGSLFMAYPADVLRAASASNDMKLLADCVYHGAGDWSRDTENGDYTEVWRTIRRLEHSSDAQTVRLAKRFRKVFDDPKNSD